MTVVFSDWRKSGDSELPYHLQIDDGERVFDYRYSNIDPSPRSPLWFFAAIDAPDIDEVQLYRLHRKLLAAHCLGDADLVSELSTAQVLLASHGELLQPPNEAVHQQFTSVFERLKYTEYHDLKAPVIEVSGASDLGWIGANVRAVGSSRKTGEVFDVQWAWVMLAKKVDGAWVHAGNAASTAD